MPAHLAPQVLEEEAAAVAEV
jgi:hypothetical protein